MSVRGCTQQVACLIGHQLALSLHSFAFVCMIQNPLFSADRLGELDRVAKAVPNQT